MLHHRCSTLQHSASLICGLDLVREAVRQGMLLLEFLTRFLSKVRMKAIALTALLLVTGCSLLQPSWHWSKPGASEADYDADIRFCKSQTDQAIDGTVTNASVRRIHACMERRGWRKVQHP